MHGRLSVKELLLAGVSCSLLSLRAVLRRGIGCYEREVADVGKATDCGVGEFGSEEGRVEALENSRKRKEKAVEESGEMKKLKVELWLAIDSCLLVGRLLLWNRAASSHPGTSLDLLDCLAFCDESVVVCCTGQSLDIGLLRQLVQASSWTFFPASKHLDKLCNVEVGSAGCDAVSQLKWRESYKNGSKRVL